MSDLKEMHAAVQALADAIKLSIGDEESKNIEGMKNGMLKILHLLSNDYDVFNVNLFLESLRVYINDYKRLLYSEVTVYVYEASKTDKLATVMSNLEKVCNKAFQTDNNLEKEETKIVLKLYDHVNLASKQIDNLQMNEKKFAEQADPILKQLEHTNNELEETKKNHMGQLISIVAIFTALSFVGAGGIGTYTTVFSDVANMPLTQALVLGSLFGIIVINLLFLFLYFISKLTGMSIRMAGDDKASCIAKYPLLFVSNIGLFCIFSLSLVLFFVSKYSDSNVYPYFTSIIEYRWWIILLILAITLALLGIVFFSVVNTKRNE